MMKNMIRLLALALCLMLAFPAALAQEAAYVMGEPTKAAFLGALASGKLVTGEMTLDLELDAQALGVEQEDAAAVQLVLDTLRRTKLTAGAGLIDGGVRVALEGEIAQETGAESVAVSALADVTLEGVAVESDLIAGKRVSAKWETLLALCGMSQSDIEMIMSLKEIDLEEALAALMAQVQPVLNTAAELALPYAQTLLGFVQTLPIEIRENLTEEDYPPTALEVCVTATEKDLGALLTLLCDQLDQDATMKTLLDALLAQSGEDVTTAQMIAAVRSAAAEMTDTDTPVSVYLGMDENSLPLYLEFYVANEPTGETAYAGFFCYEDAEYGRVIEAVGGLYDAESAPMFTLYAGGNRYVDPSDPNLVYTSFEAFCYEGDVPLFDMQVLSSVKAVQDSELAAYDTIVSTNLYADDGMGTAVEVVGESETRMGLTAAGGEAITGMSTADTYIGETATKQTASSQIQIDPTADGGVTGYYRVSESAPDAGLSKLNLSILFASEAIDPAASAALEQVTLETVSNDGMNALIAQLEETLTGDKLPALMRVLPQELVALIAGEAE